MGYNLNVSSVSVFFKTKYAEIVILGEQFDFEKD